MTHSEKKREELTLEQKVARWAENSGRTLEMAVAQAARSAGAQAVQSVPYTDVNESKDRETDVLAEFDGREGAEIPVTLVIECKRAHGSHWATFPYDAGRISSQPIMDHALTDSSDALRLSILDDVWRRGRSIFSSDPQIGSGLVQADLNAKDEPDPNKNKDEASAALRQVWSAARGVMAAELNGIPTARIVVPVIVTGAQLWECRIDDEARPAATNVEYLRVRTPATGSAVLVHVMGLDYFRLFAHQVAELQRLTLR